LSKCTAMLTSDPFSSVFIIRTVFLFDVGLARGAETT
jgi:hypothetical protein